MERSTDVPRELVLVIQALVVVLVVSPRFQPQALLSRMSRRLRRETP